MPCELSADLWRADYQEAREEGLKTGRPLFLVFEGSDWCHWCHRLDTELLSDPVFRSAASARLVPVRIDFPRRRRLPKWQERRNQSVARQFGVKAYPTVLLVDPETDSVLLRHAYLDIAVDEYLETVLGPHLIVKGP